MGPFCIKETGKYGKGLFATRDIKKDELIEVSPVIVSPRNEWKYMKKTILLNYCFHWGKRTAIALGYGALFNHSYTPNVRFVNNKKNLSIDFYAIDDINNGEELTINYNGDPEDKSKLWFEVIE
ncbi:MULTISPECIES: SET domain-containing protein [unclassified Bacillus (in: firmicutes)]|uniref:SET domain-containing protein n=1 Tax=unclassified Bacillus (in: firmicutes) TaxID=185979 RepID=UPI0006ADA3BF|nr:MULTISPECIES: SET domain-containing protein [unclassified Bacillus (in: firmicutes)]ALC86107.1 lysine methyltransferase [Bacillus sp. FJAT-22090]MDF2068577.1 SET domain-containing protein [Bacillus sp. Cr_A10]